jgi:hypothetical protein
MKKFWVALLTFAVGLLAFGLFSFKTSFNLGVKEVSLNESPASVITSIPDFQPEKLQDIKPEDNLPFFNSFEYDKEKVDPTNEYLVQSFSGWFITDNFKRMPEVWTILLSRDSKHPQTKKFQWTAMVLTNLKDGSSDDEAHFSSIWIKTENNKLSFKTKKYQNVEYKFVGEFLRNGKNFSEEEKVLKGTIQKFVKGKKIAEFTSDFAYFEPRCFH